MLKRVRDAMTTLGDIIASRHDLFSSILEPA